jgi:nitroimidazol reductase NimA-like FMN-containing flavoprotein (pyridoxamine 5'-phosphate oxidase superfamily)
MFPVRLAKRECTDTQKIGVFLAAAKVGFLGLAAESMPYVVPLNYVWWKEAVYFHGAAEGRKIEDMQKNANVCFTISEEYGTMTSPIPAHTDTAYMSVMIMGSVEQVTSLDEAAQAMQHMLDKYVPGYYDQPLAKSHLDKYRSSMGSKTAVFRITPVSISAKENELNDESKFYPGRTIRGDKENG